MNGDVGKQYCGVCPPSTPDTPSSMAVESPVEAPASSSSSSSSPTDAAASTASLPSIKASVPEAVEEMAAAAQNSEPEGSPDGNSEGSAPFVTSQQNGEVTSESGSQTSASLLPTPPSLPSPSLPSPVTSSNDLLPEDSGTSENQGTQTTPAQTPTSLTPSATPVAQPQQAAQPPLLTRDQIQQLVAQQVEYFFSRENLTSDPYLISQMDSDQYVPVFILANCSQFKNITKDHSIIVEALKESPYVQLDEDNSRVRPNYKRCIVILREIPESTPVEEIEAIFNEDDCPRVVSCEFVHNSSWYVTFESDEDAQKAYWYLRGTVQTFRGKPILARIKTKPISRLGCLSVLPSYGGKGGNDGKEGTGPASAPGSAGLPAGTCTPQQQNANFNPPTGQRFMYSPPTSVNPNSYPPTYTMPANMPTAFFYPNMVQWTAPGSFFDMSSFLQYNGLSPQAAFKPPTTNHVRYNQNRRNNKRDGRYDKREGHNGNPGGGNANQNVHMAGHYHNSPRPYHRPQASQSPSLSSHRTNHPPPPPPTNNNGGGPPPPPPPTPPPSSHPSTPPVSNHHTFAQCDLALASQSDLYTSFSPPINRSTHHVRNTDKSEAPVTLPSSQSGSLSNCGTPSSSTTSVLNGNMAATTVTPAVVTSVVASTMTNATPTTSNEHHHTQQSSQPSGPPPPPSHRGNFSYHHYIPREPQPPRQLSRGGRRRPRGRDDETMQSGNSRSMPQRGMASQPTSTEKTGNNNQESTPPPPPPPQFDLQATAFPPLPGADEQVPVAEEKRPAEPLPSLWGSDTQRFSDVMKGTAKPRPASQSSIGEKDSSPPEPTVPSSTATTSPPCPIVTAVPTVTVAATTASQITSTTSSSIPSQSVSTVVPVTVTNTTVSSSAVNTLPSSSNSQTNVSCNKQSETTRPSPREQQRGNREDRRLGASGGYRERRDYTRDHQRDHPRDMLRTGNVRERDYHRLGREGSLRSGGKENRPVPSRQWKEEKADADGWITKGPREPPRSHREVNRDHREKQETRTALVNGESSPPPSPKTPKTETETSCSEEKLCSQSLNNNDGEHKTSWAKMALASKDRMERLAAELKEKEEHEKKLKHHTRPQAKPQEKVLTPRERDGKPLRRDGPPRENRLSSERGGPVPFRPRDSARPKSPK